MLKRLPNPVSSEHLSSYQSVAIPKLLETLTQQENRGIVFLSSVGPMFAFRSPESMTKIFERCRVSFVERPFNMPFARVSDVRVDLPYASGNIGMMRFDVRGPNGLHKSTEGVHRNLFSNAVD